MSTMKQEIKELLENVDYDDLKDLRNEATKKLSDVRNRDRLFFRIYLPKEHVENFERAVDWAVKKGMIKKKTRWAFAKFCVLNVIDQILLEIEKEKVLRQKDDMALRATNPSPFVPAEVRLD